MNINPKDPFADIDESEFEAELAREDKPATVSPHVENIGNVEVPGFVEDCPKCRGTGTWRPGYRCFKCKGTGKLQFKTSPEARAKGRQSARRSTEKRKKTLAANFGEWLQNECPDVLQWLKDNAGSQFASSLLHGGKKYGHLTEGQVAAVRKAIARDSDGAAGFEAWCENHEGVLDWLTAEAEGGNEFADSLLTAGRRYGSLTEGQLSAVLKNLDKGTRSDLNASDIDLSPLVKGYYAVPDGETRLKIAIRRPNKASKYHGWIFVDDGAAYGQRNNYGRQAPDGMYQGSIQDELRAVLADPLAAMVAYGRLTGTCGKCGRVLEDEESIAAGIGPVCASKM